MNCSVDIYRPFGYSGEKKSFDFYWEWMKWRKWKNQQQSVLNAYQKWATLEMSQNVWKAFSQHLREACILNISSWSEQTISFAWLCLSWGLHIPTQYNVCQYGQLTEFGNIKLTKYMDLFKCIEILENIIQRQYHSKFKCSNQKL